jgi:type III secretion protein F
MYITGYSVEGTNDSQDLGYLPDLSEQFDAGVASLVATANAALDDVQKHPDDPTYLSTYQADFTEETLYRNLQSSVVKKWGDTDSGVISNFR